MNSVTIVNEKMKEKRKLLKQKNWILALSTDVKTLVQDIYLFYKK